MESGIINLNIVPVRKEDNAKSEMISQLFFGETITIIKIINKWSFVKSNIDNYEGWVRNLHYKKLSNVEYLEISNKKNIFSSTELKVKDIINEIVVCLEEKRKILVLSDRRDHLKAIKLLIDKIPKYTCGFYLGGMKEKDLQETEKKEFQHESPYQLRSNVLLPRFYMHLSQEHIQIRTNQPTNQSHYKMPSKKYILANVLSVFEAAQWTSFQETSFPEEIQLLKQGD